MAIILPIQHSNKIRTTRIATAQTGKQDIKLPDFKYTVYQFIEDIKKDNIKKIKDNYDNPSNTTIS